MNETEQRAQSRYEDEISLVDLATTFIRRRSVFYVVFASIVGIALLYTLFLVGEVREYSTLVQLGEDKDKPLEQPQAVIASIESYWYPELLGEYRAMANEKLPFGIAASNPESTSLIKLSSETSPELAKTVKEYHQKLVSNVTNRQADLLNRQKRELERRIASLQEYLDELSGIEASGEAQAQLIQERSRMLSEIESIKARIDRLSPAQVLVIARESLENKGTSKKLILVLAMVMAFVFGIFATFIAEFVAHVRQAVKEER